MNRKRLREPPVFLDTSALLALVNSDDALHQRAQLVQQELEEAGATLATSEWVLTEFLNHTAARERRGTGVATVRAILSSGRVLVSPATRVGWRAAFGLYKSRSDKDWSLVDCSSILLCREEGVERVFTHDRHFLQAGFKVLLRS